MALPTFGTLINSFNFFIDTSNDVGEGDDANIQLANNKISCGDGQLLRLCLTEFSMYRNFYSVNTNNNKIRLTTNLDAEPQGIEIPSQNYRTVGEYARAFADQMVTFFTAKSGVNCTADVLPLEKAYINSQGDRILKITLNFAAAHNFSTFRLQCFSDLGDSHILLGADRIDDPASLEPRLGTAMMERTVKNQQMTYPACNNCIALAFS